MRPPHRGGRRRSRRRTASWRTRPTGATMNDLHRLLTSGADYADNGVGDTGAAIDNDPVASADSVTGRRGYALLRREGLHHVEVFYGRVVSVPTTGDIPITPGSAT